MRYVNSLKSKGFFTSKMSQILDIRQYESAVQFLKDYLNLIQKKNPSFSQRAYCLRLAPENHHLLSKVLKKERPMNLELALKISQNLRLGEKEREFFLEMVRNENPKSPDEVSLFNFRKSCSRHAVLRDDTDIYTLGHTWIMNVENQIEDQEIELRRSFVTGNLSERNEFIYRFGKKGKRLAINLASIDGSIANQKYVLRPNDPNFKGANYGSSNISAWGITNYHGTYTKKDAQGTHEISMIGKDEFGQDHFRVFCDFKGKGGYKYISIGDYISKSAFESLAAAWEQDISIYNYFSLARRLSRTVDRYIHF